MGLPAAGPGGRRPGRAQAGTAGTRRGCGWPSEARGEGLGRQPARPGGRGTGPGQREPHLKLGQGGPLGASMRRRLGDQRQLAPRFAARQRHDGGRARQRRGPGQVQGPVAAGSAGRFPARRLLAGRPRTCAAPGSAASRMGRSLLGGSVFSRSLGAAPVGRPPRKPASSLGRSAFLGRSPFLGRSSWIGRSSGLGRSSSPSLSSFTGRPSSLRRAGKLMRSSPGGSATGHAPPVLPAQRARPADRRAAHGRPGASRDLRSSQTALGSSPGGARPGPRRQRQLARPAAGCAAPRLSGGLSGWAACPARLHMPRPRMQKKRWRTGGYR